MSAFTLYPAIDLKDGQCVRLFKGDMDKATVFSDVPGAQAASFEAAGAPWVHVVDLNGAFAGHAVNADAVADILANVKVPVQLGGGIRSLDMIEAWLDRGVSRVILGTMALKSPALVIDACREFPGQVAVGIDARGGFVAVEGWAEVSDMPVIDLARRFEDAGVSAIIYTDIDRDGTLEGPNVAATVALQGATTIPVIASGGIGVMQDLIDLKAAGITGAVTGRALYDGRIDLASAIKALTS